MRRSSHRVAYLVLPDADGSGDFNCSGTPLMRIGLVRHFPVREAWPSGWLTPEDRQHWRARYCVLAWLTGHHSQRLARDEFRQRICAIADLLEAEPVDTLVVSHPGVMFFLRNELLLRGFKGPRFKLAANAKLYLFERFE